MFSCEFGEISKKTFFTEHLWTTASVSWRAFELLLAKCFDIFDLKFS